MKRVWCLFAILLLCVTAFSACFPTAPVPGSDTESNSLSESLADSESDTTEESVPEEDLVREVVPRDLIPGVPVEYEVLATTRGIHLQSPIGLFRELSELKAWEGYQKARSDVKKLLENRMDAIDPSTHSLLVISVSRSSSDGSNFGLDEILVQENGLVAIYRSRAGWITTADIGSQITFVKIKNSDLPQGECKLHVCAYSETNEYVSSAYLLPYTVQVPADRPFTRALSKDEIPGTRLEFSSLYAVLTDPYLPDGTELLILRTDEEVTAYLEGLTVDEAKKTKLREKFEAVDLAVESIVIVKARYCFFTDGPNFALTDLILQEGRLVALYKSGARSIYGDFGGSKPHITFATVKKAALPEEDLGLKICGYSTQDEAIGSTCHRQYCVRNEGE
ncbi:MAG: hypothetical protein IKA05_04000 [Clostridia bacterium]|nr:hypothetical protein [Clostridia bacterium]